jgi:hypothetical protein
MPSRKAQTLFNTYSVRMATSLTRDVAEAIDSCDRTMPAEDRLSFMLALLVRHADVLHDLVATFLVRDATSKTGHASPEAKLLAAAFSHLASHATNRENPSDPHQALHLAKSYLRKLGHDVPATVPWLEEG